eukprot:2373669-Amphidinium_carterae.1
MAGKAAKQEAGVQSCLSRIGIDWESRLGTKPAVVTRRCAFTRSCTHSITCLHTLRLSVLSCQGKCPKQSVQCILNHVGVPEAPET